jgi:DNA-binding transcriptional ArsR family regulator
MKTTKTTKKTSAKKVSEIDFSALPNATVVIRTVDNRFRKSIIALLESKKELNVTQIYTELEMQQEVASIHLRALKSVGVVKSRREHKLVYYSLNTDTLNSLLSVLSRVAEFLIADQ